MSETETIIPETVDEQPKELVISKSPFKDESWQSEGELASNIQAEGDPVIKEKDKKIIEEERENTKPDQPEAVPTATPKDIPARPKEDKENITPATELKFANETSEKVFNLLKEGKEAEVIEILSQKQKLSNLDNLKSEEVIKLQLQNEYKDYTKEEIEDLYAEKFSAERPEQSLEETDDEYEERMKIFDEKLERKLSREAKSAKAELQKLNEELILPDITNPTPKQQEQSQEELAAIEKVRESYLKSISGAIDSFDGMTATYKDEDVEIPAKYSPNKEEKAQLKQLMEDFDMNDYFSKRWLGEDATTLDASKIAADLFRLEFGDKAVAEIANKVGNKRYAETIKQQANVDYSGQRRSSNVDMTAQAKTDAAVKKMFAE